jgi:fatty acid desaturase
LLLKALLQVGKCSRQNNAHINWVKYCLVLGRNIRRNDAGEVEVTASHTNQYAELKQLIREKGLLDKQPAYYTYKILFTLCLLALSVAFLVIITNPWLQVLNAAFAAFVFNQVGFIGHDLGHRQLFRGARKNMIGIHIFTLLLGISGELWIRTHNQHHSNPNNSDLDPDIDVPVLAFTREEARSKQGIARFILKYQAYFYVPLTCLLPFAQHGRGIQFLLHRRGKHTAAEALCMAIHFVLYIGLPVYFLTLWQAVLIVVIHQGLYGLLMASVFAPNHKGMPVLDKDSRLDFLHRQVLTSRNVRAHPLTDFWYGGLNYQIEHHLFPSMPRNKLGEAQTIVKAFCHARSIPYQETGLLESYQSILQYLHEISAVLRDGTERDSWVETSDHLFDKTRRELK